MSSNRDELHQAAVAICKDVLHYLVERSAAPNDHKRFFRSLVPVCNQEKINTELSASNLCLASQREPFVRASVDRETEHQ